MKILIGLLIILIIFMTSGVVYLMFKGRIFIKLYHDTLGWHISDDKSMKFDGCNTHARCKICGKEIMQDSQGNWF